MDIHTDRENEEKRRRNYIELAIAAVVGVGIGLAIGWQLAGRHYGEEMAELQWKLEMQAQAEQEQQELEKNAAEILVYVVGEVEKPGVVSLKEGARLYEAVEQAVPLEDAAVDSLPMARLLTDGETVSVPQIGAEGIVADGMVPVSSANGKININQASAAELAAALPGIGEKLALRIVNYRESHGDFASEHDLVNVSGIGEARYEELAGLITVK